jgi:hypothetical protein
MRWPWSKTKCQPIIRYDGINITFAGVEGPEPVQFKIGNFQLKREVLQAAIDIAQMYDLFAYRNCERIEKFSKDTPERVQFILETAKADERILEFFAILRIALARPSDAIEKSLSDWVAFTFTKKIREEAPIETEKLRAGEFVREQPPVEQYDELKRNVAQARISSPYFKDALENPHFDMETVYRLGIT